MDNEVKRATRSHAALITRIQEDLRVRCHQQPENAEAIWANHCHDAVVLDQYAKSMEYLAQCGWQSWLGQTSNECRIAWCRNFYRSYFFQDRGGWEEKLTTRDKKLCSRHALEPVDGQKISFSGRGRVRLLDVGSCYNPFRAFDDTEALAIDLAPVPNSGVAKCDFLAVPIVDNLEAGRTPEEPSDSLKEISSNFFDVVVFSLVLSYLPTPAMRFRCCKRAYEVLRHNGLLLVISPDSKRRGKNDQLVKSWRIALECVGFHCLVQEKMTHLQAVAFRKNEFVELEQREGAKLLALFEAKTGRKYELDTMMWIPQDFRSDEEEVEECHNEELNGEEKVEGFSELPLLDCSDDE